MGLGRFLAAMVLALGVTALSIGALSIGALSIGDGALAQQATPPVPAKEYNQQILVPGSWFHGVHGLAFNKDDQLFAGSVIGQSIYRVQVDSGEVDRFIGEPNGMADDIAFADDGTMAWTAFLLARSSFASPTARSSRSPTAWPAPTRSPSARMGGCSCRKSSSATPCTRSISRTSTSPSSSPSRATTCAASPTSWAA
jgi:hypothetical protein